MMLPEAYSRFRDELAGMLDSRFYTIGWLDCQVFNGAIRVLGNDDAVILYEFKTFPTGWRELQGTAAAGDLDVIVDVLIPEAENIAKKLNCGSAQIASREGWSRVLKKRGYEVDQVTIQKVF